MELGDFWKRARLPILAVWQADHLEQNPCPNWIWVVDPVNLPVAPAVVGSRLAMQPSTGWPPQTVVATGSGDGVEAPSTKSSALNKPCEDQESKRGLAWAGGRCSSGREGPTGGLGVGGTLWRLGTKERVPGQESWPALAVRATAVQALGRSSSGGKGPAHTGPGRGCRCGGGVPRVGVGIYRPVHAGQPWGRQGAAAVVCTHAPGTHQQCVPRKQEERGSGRARVVARVIPSTRRKKGYFAGAETQPRRVVRCEKNRSEHGGRYHGGEGRN